MADHAAPLPCIVCGTQPDPVHPGDDEGPAQPLNAAVFTSHGNYGSAFDPCDGSRLRVNLCDPCITAKAAAGAVWHEKIERGDPVVVFSQPYNPEATG